MTSKFNGVFSGGIWAGVFPEALGIVELGQWVTWVKDSYIRAFRLKISEPYTGAVVFWLRYLVKWNWGH